LEDNAAAVHKYGQIEDWDVSQVTDLSYLFCVRQKEMEGDKHYKHCVLPEYARDFDFDLSRWDTSRVTSMRGTFSFAQGFNQPIGSWRTSSVTDMDEMFSGKVSDQEATGFNQPIEHWDVSRVKTMERMFKDAAVCTRRLFTRCDGVDACRLQERRPRVVFFSILRPFGPRDPHAGLQPAVVVVADGVRDLIAGDVQGRGVFQSEHWRLGRFFGEQRGGHLPGRGFV